MKLEVHSIGAASEPYSGTVYDENGLQVGILDAFRFSFVDPPVLSRARPNLSERAPASALVPLLKPVALFGPRIRVTADELVIANRLRGLNGRDIGAEIAFETQCPQVHIQFHAHGWSGICEVLLDDTLYKQIDLFNRETALPHTLIVELRDLSRPHLIRIRPSGSVNPASAGRQILIEKLFESDGDYQPAVYAKKSSVNHGASFHARFHEILRQLPSDAVVVDVGGGKRQIDDARYINLEYSAYEEPDILGDGTRLPFKSGSIDMIYTAAVLEHVRDPLAMGREIFRVLKPSGRILANSAFMQPIHSEGQHFFNSTPYGIREIFRMFPDGNIWWEGSFSHLVKWLFDASGIHNKIPLADASDFLRLADSFDKHVEYNRLMYIASGVWFESVKP